MKQDTARRLRDFSQDTSVDPKNPYHTKKYFEGRLFWSLFFFAFSYFHFWGDFWKLEFWKLWSKYIIAKKPALANGL